MDILDQAILEAEAAAYVIFSSSQDADMRYLTNFVVNDPLIYFKRPGERGTLIVPQMEFERAMDESMCNVITRAEAGFFEISKEENNGWKINAKMIFQLLNGDILVPARFPVALARELESYSSISIDRGSVEKMRSVKTSRELGFIRKTQYVTQGAMDVAITMLRNASLDDGVLSLDGRSLTSDDIRHAMHRYLLDRGYRAVDTIVSCGPETSMPHRLGDGQILEGMPIVLDIFPRDERTGYYSDMTRTVVRGDPDPEIAAMYSAVKEAQELAANMIRPGIPGREIHQAVVDYFDDSGYRTDTEGFIHSLGHGVGLQIHEMPSLSPSGEELEPGQVITIEPGLYYRGIGGVRLEDIGVVTQQGFDSFTKYEKVLRL